MLNGVLETQNLKLLINTNLMTRVMCSPWKRTFTLAPLTPLTMFSSIRKKSICEASKAHAINRILGFFLSINIVKKTQFGQL
jgi:hypothetical protein